MPDSRASRQQRHQQNVPPVPVELVPPVSVDELPPVAELPPVPAPDEPPGPEMPRLLLHATETRPTSPTNANFLVSIMFGFSDRQKGGRLRWEPSTRGWAVNADRAR